MWSTLNHFIDYHNKNENNIIVENKLLVLRYKVFDNIMLSKMIAKLTIICFHQIELIYENDVIYDYQITQSL